MIKLIAAIGEHRELGKDNQLLWSVPGELKHFKKETQGQVVVMGRKTFESIGSKPLPDRINLVMTRDTQWASNGVVTVNNVDHALTLVNTRFDDRDLYVIGGAEIYAAFAPHADEVIVTELPASFPDADTYFIDPDACGPMELKGVERFTLSEDDVATPSSIRHYDIVRFARVYPV